MTESFYLKLAVGYKDYWTNQLPKLGLFSSDIPRSYPELYQDIYLLDPSYPYHDGYDH